MVGRAYTMKEHKQIVDYLVQQRAYNEIRGRRKWMDLASTKILDRTWQSMKETFLKRILPDIHNPYYKLTVEQIASFKQECDVGAKNKNRLEVQTISDSSSTDNHRAKEQAGDKEDERSGEDKCSKIQNRTRSSTETLVLENCDEITEDVQKEKSPTKTDQAQKSLRDFITYSEPLTPMLQEVLHDFSSDDDPPMQIVEEPENLPADSENVNRSKSPETIRESQSYNKKTVNIDTGDDTDQKMQTSKIKSLKLKKTRKGTWENKEPVGDAASVPEKETNNNNSDMVFTAQDHMIKAIAADTEKNHSTSTIDTQLPNNQEGLGDQPNNNTDALVINRKSTESSNSDFVEPRKKKKDKARKRSHSQSSVERKKKKKDKNRNSTETNEQENVTGTFNSHPHATTVLNELVNGTPIVKEISNNKTELTNDTNIPPNVVVEDTTAKGIEGTSQEAGPSGVNNADINPCLKSVSLFEEQFSQSKYSDSDDEATPKDTSKQQETIENNHVKDTSKETDATNLSKDSAGNGIENPTTSKNINMDDVLLLKSYSETSSENFEAHKKKVPVNSVKKSVEKGLANVFGFASGGVFKRPMNHNKSSSRRFSHQRHRINSRSYNVDSGSSDDYTTASDSDSPPQHSHNRNNGHRKYIKPSSFDFLSHENGLFVVGRKKIYPLILRENGSLHYTCATEGIDNEQADSYWKAKYLEEKRKLYEEKLRADELARLLQRAHEREEKQPKSPILQANQSMSKILNKNQPIQVKDTIAESKPEEKVKIKFNKNKDIELEGQWTNINPILERMVEIFKNNDTGTEITKQETESKTEEKIPRKPGEISLSESAKPKNKRNLSRKTNVKERTILIRDSGEKDDDEKTETVSLSSDKSTPSVVTPADPEIHKKIDKLESEIFEKIAAIEKTDGSINENNPKEQLSDTNITTRKRGRPRKVAAAIQTNSRSTASLDTAPKRRASSIGSIPKKARAQSESIENIPKKARAQSGSIENIPKKVRAHCESIENIPKKARAQSESIENIPINGRAQSVEHVPKKPRTVSEGPGMKDNLTSDNSVTSASDNEAGNRRSTRAPKRFGSEDNLVAEPKQATPVSKSKTSLPETPTGEVSIPEDDQVRYMFPPKTKRLARGRPRRYFVTERAKTFENIINQNSRTSTDNQDSDLTSPNINVTRRKRKLTTVSLVYKKGPIRRVRRKSCPYLADDDSCSTNESQSQKSTTPNNSQTLNSEVYRSDSYQILMPRAKQLTKSLLDKIEENPANETDTNKNNTCTPLTHHTPKDDVRNNSRQKFPEPNSSSISLPLSPELSIVENLSVSKDLISSSLEEPPTLNETNLNSGIPTTSNKFMISGVDVSMPLMEQDCGFQKKKPRDRRTTFSESLEEEQYSSESLDQKLRDLLLESAKKIAKGNTEVPQDMEVDTVASEKKTRINKRRSSTPQKRKSVLRSKTPEVDPVIEEHIETCSLSGRQSCPPAIHIMPCEENTNISNNNNETPEKKLVRGRKKKDIIKVKILRPRSRSFTKDVTQTSKLSVFTDSGINDTESGVSEECPCCDITTEIIHNHSDTCLHMEECVGDSLEIVEDANQSVISLNSNSIPSEIHNENRRTILDTTNFVSSEMFCSNAQEATSLNIVKNPQRNSDEATTAFFTPSSGQSFNSLITDDLSDEIKHSPTKWYLVNEQETNFVDTCSQQSNSSVGANLNKIFTPCAVPDLSTISERSKENDTKTAINTDTESDPISQSLFDFEF